LIGKSADKNDLRFKMFANKLKLSERCFKFFTTLSSGLTRFRSIKNFRNLFFKNFLTKNQGLEKLIGQKSEAEQCYHGVHT